jgi:hypothetical protein
MNALYRRCRRKLAGLAILDQDAVAKGGLEMSAQEPNQSPENVLKIKVMMSSPTTWTGSGTRNEPVVYGRSFSEPDF